MRKFLAGLAAAIFAFTPVLASAQTIGYSPHTLPLSGSCGTVVLSTPCFDVTQTWNAGGVTFTGIRENITDTASASGSLLMDLQVGGASKFSVDKTGTVSAAAQFGLAGGAGGYWSSGSVGLPNSAAYTFSSTASGLGSADIFLRRDAANTLALRNGVNANSFKVANTYTDASNYEYGVFDWVLNSNSLTIGTTKAGTGVNRAVQFMVGGTNVFNLASSSGNMLWNTDNTYDIGASGASRPRNLFLGGSATIAGSVNTSQVKTTIGTLSGAGTCGAGGEGLRGFVSDATVAASGNFGTAVTGGGANKVPIYCDGTSWKIG